jgi:hypothetical protein
MDEMGLLPRRRRAMDEQKFEAIIRRVVRDEIELTLYCAPPHATERVRSDFAMTVREELKGLVTDIVGVKISEASVGHSADAIASGVVDRFKRLCDEVLLPSVEKTVRNTIDPYIRYVDILLRRYEDESDWWKQGTEGSDDPQTPGELPSESRRSGKPRSLDHELIREVLREELKQSMGALMREISTAFRGHLDLGADPFVQDLRRGNGTSGSPDAEGSSDDEFNIPY